MTVLFRVDGSTAIGTGHVMRCLALAQALHDHGARTLFLCSEISPALRKRLEDEGCALRTLDGTPYGVGDAQRTIAEAGSAGAEWIVVDGYGFTKEFRSAMEPFGSNVLWIDDNAVVQDAKGTILNQNVYADERMYADGASLLLGPLYLLLRREFAAAHEVTRTTKDAVSNVLVTLGGADPDNLTRDVLTAMNAIESPLAITVVIGGTNPHAQTIEKAAKESHHRVTVHTDVTDFPPLMMEADIGIFGGGTSSYEAACLGLPMLTLVLADNQEHVAAGMAEAGVTVNLGRNTKGLAAAFRSLADDAQRRQAMTDAGRDLVDGEGAGRTAMKLLGTSIRLRPARAGDCEMLWHWANEPETRAASFSTNEIPWQDHVGWFTKKIADPKTFFWIGLDSEDVPVGYLRIEERDGRHILSVGVDTGKRGKGYAKELVRQGAQRFFSRCPGATIDAYVKPENEASAKLFRSAGFREESTKAGEPLHFTVTLGA